MSAIVAPLRDIARELGWPKALAVAARWAFEVEFSVVAFEHGPTRDYPPLPSLDGLRLSALGEADVEHVARMNPLVGADELRRRLAAGMRGLLVWEGERLVHVRWVGEVDHELPYLGLGIRLAAGDHYRFGSYTLPGSRDRGLQRTLTAWSLHDSRARGARRSLGLVARWNEPGRRSVLRNGWREIGAIGFRRIGPFRRYFARGAARFGPDRSFTVEPTGGESVAALR